MFLQTETGNGGRKHHLPLAPCLLSPLTIHTPPRTGSLEWPDPSSAVLLNLQSAALARSGFQPLGSQSPFPFSSLSEFLISGVSFSGAFRYA